MENKFEKKKYSENKRRTVNKREDSARRDRVQQVRKQMSNVAVGRNAVHELLRSGEPIDKICVSAHDGSIAYLISEAKAAGITVVDSTFEALERLSDGENHQGIVALIAEKKYSTVDEILDIAKQRDELPLIVVCDGVEDPHNLGAIMRCAECSGAHGIIIPERRACGLTPAVSKASAGAIAHMAVAKVVNIAETVELLKKKGIWTFAAEADGMDFYEADFKCPCAIVLGGEDRGVGRLVRERCDFTISIPMYGKVNSLNVSTAASVLLTRAARIQRT